MFFAEKERDTVNYGHIGVFVDWTKNDVYSYTEYQFKQKQILDI